MESPLKQRLIGAAVLAALAIIFLPMLLKGPDVKEPDAAQVPLSMPAAPGDAFETRELPLTTPESPAAGGVLGMQRAPAGQPAVDATPVDGAEVETGTVAETDAPIAPTTPAAATPAAAPTKPAPDLAPATRPEAPTAADQDARVAAGDHALTVGTYANTASATALAARLRAAGLPVLSERVSLATGAATRIRVGPFGSRAAAEASRLRVEQISGAPSKAIVLDAREPSTPKPAAGPAPAPSKAVASGTASTAAPKPAVTSGFAVQLSAPSNEGDANALRDRARAAGFASFVQRVDTATGARFRVRLGPVADRAAAEAMQADSRAKLDMAGIVVAHP